MALNQVKVKLAPEGNLNIPSAITQQAGFSPDEEAIIILTDDGLFVRREKSITADDVLHTLLASGEIRFSDLGEGLGGNLLAGTTLERIHEALTGVSIPIEDIIHEERKKYDQRISPVT